MEIENNDIENVEIGDIIWAKRYKNHQPEPKKSHSKGPYIVVSKCANGLICSFGTSVIPDEKYENLFYKVSQNNYPLTKDTYFRLTYLHVIDNFRFIKLMSSFDKQDLADLLIKLKIHGHLFYQINSQKHYLDLYLQNGDIIIYKNNEYIVLNITSNEILATPINGSNITSYDIYNLDFSKLVIFDRNTPFIIKTSLDQKLYISLLKSYQTYLKNKQKENTIQIGSIVRKNNILYYIYGKNAQDWLAFKLSKYKQNDYDVLNILNNNYYTDYKNINLNQEEKYILVDNLTEEIKEYIKHKKKSYIKKDSKSKRISYDLCIGDIIEHKLYNSGKYIIISTYGGKIYCIPIDKIKEGIIKTISFTKEEVKISTDQSITGIKWLEENPNFNLTRIDEVIDEIIKTQQKYLENNLSRKLS
ncbi:MAG: hypothetical protein E7172_02725 [Firmicutes bacterium]|nr:hypothetical protein [Bacillota bacterium]